MFTTLKRFLAACSSFVPLALTVACSSSDAAPSGASGGAAGSGGVVPTGGASNPRGGTLSSGGAALTGGAGSGGTAIGGSGSGGSSIPDAAPDGDAGDASQLLVSVASGTLRGKRMGGSLVFLGIPFAAPPIGARRFAPPAPTIPWNGVRDATESGRACPQKLFPPAVEGAPTAGPWAEDCLTLDVYRPAVARGPLPVLVYLYGGGFAFGANRLYDGHYLAEAAGAVVVTVNYRVGRLGFLAHPALDAVLSVPSGNMGLRDQRAALEWVRDNIATFGGDPGEVTLFGQSAGALSTCLHYFASGDTPAHRYILQSGSCLASPEMSTAPSALGPRTRPAALDAGTKLAGQLCPGATDVVKCLRDLPVESLVDTGDFNGSGYDAAAWPNIDGHFLAGPPVQLLREGKFKRAPIVIGTNVNDSAWNIPEGYPGATGGKLDMLLLLMVVHPQDFQRVYTRYEPKTEADAKPQTTLAMTNDQFRCPSRLLARGVASAGVPVYVYSFALPPAPHSLELDYVFGWPGGNISRETSGAPLPPIAGLIDTMQGYWGTFARTGDPNGGGRPAWPRYDPAKDENIVLAEPISLQANLEKNNCDWWEQTYLPR
jgi:para-nitrobenzyl esterase